MDIRINQRGFTLIEILVAAIIMVILGAGFLGLQYIYSQNQLVAWKNYLSIEDTNSAISTLVRELRDVRDADNGDYLLEVASDQEIIFYSDIDYDGAVERVRYTLSGSVLTKGVIEPTGVPVTYPSANERTKTVSDIIRNDTDTVFYYYNSDWPKDTVNNPLGPVSRITHTRLVKIVLSANPKPNDPGKDYVLETNTKMRNLIEESTCYFNNPQPPGSTSSLCAPPSSGSPSSSCGSFGGGICCRHECIGGYSHWCERTSGPPGSCNGYMDCGIECK